MDFLYLKALHIIFVITWFAGLFYIVRLFIYHSEAESNEPISKKILQEQYKIMSKRLWYIITWPSAIVTGILGSSLLISNPGYLELPWMHLKLAFVTLLYGYHYCCHLIFKKLQNDSVTISSLRLRIWNEVATVLLFSIVFLVVLKNTINWIWGTLGLIALSVVLMIAVKWYKRIRS